MEHAPLRPVPARPAGPIDPASASRVLAQALPELEPREADALALVALAGRPRVQVAGELGVPPGELAELLASARKALRRTLVLLTASGWCERAERLISDRLDGELDERGAARLDVHLRNCPRCVEHERRLVQATDALVATASEPAPPPPAAEEPPVELTVVGAEAPAEPAPARSRGQRASAAAWTVLVVVAVILAVASLALAAAGVLGADI